MLLAKKKIVAASAVQNARAVCNCTKYETAFTCITARGRARVAVLAGKPIYLEFALT
jgi:hypothetical protein